ncbi:synembryn-A isoform X2 [Ceratina calcarata]|uniref:Synembryn-A isoform X2 n=1 Tax=Ceratina calcarata TaxID=156304 RepID=A0AAJ7S3X9_9HYME|nr:synembryn-A isoform X2 [Ceratina calcarata]
MSDSQRISPLSKKVRDKTNLNELITDERIDVLLDIADLKDVNSNGPTTCTNVTVEALKLLCNLIYNSTRLQRLLPRTTTCLRCLIERMRKYDDDDSVPLEVMLFDTRIVFLITALNVATRRIIRTELKGDECLIKMLGNVRQRAGSRAIDHDGSTLACEVLKALFNLYINFEETEEEEKTEELVSILYKLLLSKCKNEDELQSNIVNLLTVIPRDRYSAIVPPTDEVHERVFEKLDMSAVAVLLKFLDERLDRNEDLIGNLSPIVTAFVKMARAERPIRKYARLRILPPLRDVMHRPEEGTTLRAKLCKLLTSPVTEVRDLVAEFLFILCKENVSRMVKYTGYGNAAGMFANKGLLGASGKKPVYSSESEDSETEEYLRHREQINPVTGCFESPKPDPLEGMTEEQKEYEALQLVGLVDKLTRGGLVQPCRIGNDGKPKPIEHVLELREESPEQLHGRRTSADDSDSDSD